MAAASPDLLAHTRLPSADRAARLRKRLIAWYRAGRRDLPWRRTRDPYAVWVSEAMLQQTRVETVIDYYTRFLELFPTARALAEAHEDEVLAAWSGLGYYRRARALHAAARLISSEHGGEFPREPGAALALPGIGRYTAGAVLSIAYDSPCALVDGNVERVFSRLFGLAAPAGSRPLQDACWKLAERLVPRRAGAGDWNQALMELGATVCTPRAPRCDACPLARSCSARREGRVAELPGPKQRPATIEVEIELALARERGKWLLERRPPQGRMAGLWQFPGIERTAPGRAALLFPTGWRGGARLTLGKELFDLRHAITKHRIHARVRSASAEKVPRDSPYDWFGVDELAGLALTGMTKKALTRLPS